MSLIYISCLFYKRW